MSYIKKRVSAFVFAFSGIWQAIRSESHLKIHLLAALIVIIFGFYFHVAQTEWVVLLLCCGMVIALEMVNSAIEKLCDLVTTERHPKIKYIKDVMAGAVLVASIMALIIGIILFYPYLRTLLN